MLDFTFDCHCKVDAIRCTQLSLLLYQITFQTMAETTAPKAKKPRAIAEKIATHSGTFHCDEVLACYMLQLLPEYKGASIIRTRDPELLKQCDVVVDVGGLYDPSTHRYDHHQRSVK